MIIDLIQIFRARHDKALASKLAVRFAQGQMFERATAPLLIAHFVLWAIVIIMGSLAIALILAAIKIHGSLYVIVTVPLCISLAAAWISLRLKSGSDRIKTIANSYSDAQMTRMFGQHYDQNGSKLSAPGKSEVSAKAQATRTPSPMNPSLNQDAP